MTDYKNNSSSDFKMPELSETDWEQILSNVSIVTFMQGVPIGMKYYNNYAIATSTNNKEYVDPNEIYFVKDGVGDLYYHRSGCAISGNMTGYTGYRSSDFLIRRLSTSTSTTNYYKHDNGSTGQLACYDCLVTRLNYSKQVNSAYFEALARERYVSQTN